MLLPIQIPTVTWLPPQYAKRQVLKFRLETDVTPLRGPPKTVLTIYGRYALPFFVGHILHIFCQNL